jgi:ketosteroid isomerase-like protein
VLDSWKLVLGGSKSIDIRVDRIHTCVRDSLAFVTCEEVVEAVESMGTVAATNVFELQDGVWKIVHHHGSPLRRNNT